MGGGRGGGGRGGEGRGIAKVDHLCLCGHLLVCFPGNSGQRNAANKQVRRNRKRNQAKWQTEQATNRTSM